jgi:hypothetical protein
MKVELSINRPLKKVFSTIAAKDMANKTLQIPNGLLDSQLKKRFMFQPKSSE